jgi:hypothetical protein
LGISTPLSSSSQHSWATGAWKKMWGGKRKEAPLPVGKCGFLEPVMVMMVMS